MKQCSACILGLCLLIVLICPEAQAVPVYKVQLTDGTIYERVTVKVSKTYKVITLKVDGKKRNISFTEIAGIFRAGNDMTEELLGAGYGSAARKQTQPETQTTTTDNETAVKKKQSGWVSETSEQYQQSQKPLYSAAFRVGGNYSLPTTEYYDGTTPGMGFGFDFVIPVARKIAIRFSISKSGMKHNASQLLEGTGLIPKQDGLSLSVWRYYMSAEYYSWPRIDEGGMTMYYLYSGLGVISHSFSGSIFAREYATDQLWNVTFESQSKFATTLGGGMVTMFSNTLGLDTRAAIDLVFVGSESDEYQIYGNTQHALIFDIKVGLVALIR